MDIRRNDPSSPRGRQGRSYHDMAAMRAASTPGSPLADSPDEKYVTLPEDDDDHITTLTMRKAREEGEVETVPQGLGLRTSEEGREKAE